MALGGPTVSSFQLKLSELAKTCLYEPETHISVNPILSKSTVTAGKLDPSERGWHSEHSFEASSYPLAPHPRVDLLHALGTRMVSRRLGWEHHDVRHVGRPNGYIQWGVEVLNNLSFNLKGGEEKTDYICGAIYCSLCDYEVSPSLFRSLLEKWSPQTNTFLFSCGERTITLIDMLLMAGLPIAGDPYEEYIPPLNKLDPSLLLYPNFLSTLLQTWEELSSRRKDKLVPFQDWCDYFHNHRSEPLTFTSLRDGRIYLAAFIAVWLCSFVVVGGGPYIRPGVLVMASWIAIGRKISLAPPALSSLYFSLRPISMHPVGPSYCKTLWPTHYVIAWMHLYLKKTFGAKSKGNHLPTPRSLLMQPAMLNTMFRPPNEFSPEKAHDFLEKYTNIIWCPYSSRNLTGVDQLQRAFMISVRRGILPWRFVYQNIDTCIAEPYHPDRVARQFKLDQNVPYNPLDSLFTTGDYIGVAYTYWSHLLYPTQENVQHLLSSNYEGKCALSWTNWWNKFVNPFTLILKSLRAGSAQGEIPYFERKNVYKQSGNEFMPPRGLTQSDLVIIKEVSAERRDGLIAAIEAKEKEVEDYWNPILTAFLSDNELSMDSRHKRKSKHIAADSSSHSVPSPNMQVDEHLLDSTLKEPCTAEVISSDEEARPITKRKLAFADDENISSPLRLDIPLYVSENLDCANLDIILSGDVAHGLGDFPELNVDDYGTSGLDMDPPTSSPPTTDISSHISSSLHGVENAAVSNKETSAQTAMSSMGVPFVTEVIMKAIDSAFNHALDGLNNSTIIDPQRYELLEAVHSLLPASDDIARVAAIHIALKRLICISSEMQEACKVISLQSQKRGEALAVADKERMLLEEVLEGTEEKLTSMEEQCAEKKKHVEALSAQLEEANIALHQIEEGVEQLKSVQSSKQAEAKKLRDNLSEVNAEADRELEVLQQKTSSMGNEVDSIIENMQNLPSMP